jgi:hypothetical protein
MNLCGSCNYKHSVRYIDLHEFIGHSQCRQLNIIPHTAQLTKCPRTAFKTQRMQVRLLQAKQEGCNQWRTLSSINRNVALRPQTNALHNRQVVAETYRRIQSHCFGNHRVCRRQRLKHRIMRIVQQYMNHPANSSQAIV